MPSVRMCLRAGGKLERVSDIRSRSSIARVIRQFENWKARVEQYHKESSDFRSLCEDYAICERTLEKWNASDAAIAAQRRQEYKELLEELHGEIRDWLEQQYIHDQSKKGTVPRDPHIS